jgi:hypothetical protein
VATQTHFKQPRYFALGSPAMAIVLALGIVHLFRRRRPFAWLLSFGLAAAMLVSAANYHFNWRYWRDDWRTVAQFFLDRYEPGDALVFNAGWMDLPFNHYVVKQGRKPFATERIPERNDPDPAEVNAPLGKLLQQRRRVWLILCYNGVSDPKDLVRKFLDRRAAFIRQWEFSRVTVRLYECEAKA